VKVNFHVLIFAHSEAVTGSMFDPRTVHPFVCIIRFDFDDDDLVWVFSMYNMYTCIYTKSNKVCIFTRYLESITQSLVTAYFELDHCECRQYLYKKIPGTCLLNFYKL
jgi:hypothetical protein